MFYPWHVIKDTRDDGRGVRRALMAAAIVLPAAPRRNRQSGRRHLRAATRVVLPLAVPAAEVPSRAGSNWSRRRSCPALVVGGLFALPFLDRGSSRHPWARVAASSPRGSRCVGLGLATLTALGLRDAPTRFDPEPLGAAVDRRLPDRRRRRQPPAAVATSTAARPRRCATPASAATTAGCAST